MTKQTFGRVLGVAMLAGLFITPAIADQLQIDGNYGNENGCISNADSAQISDSKILVTPQSIEFFESGCDFLQVLTASYGRSVVTALCSGEGDEWVSTYLVMPDVDDPTALNFKKQGGDEFEFTVGKCN